MSSESSVRVAVRIRPQIARELIDMCRVCTNVTPDEPQVWLGSDKAFTYDYVFDMPTSQDNVYKICVEDLVEGCLEGYNATVLAYGQTGSGKTYTMGTGLDMETGPDTVGIIPRAVSHLFHGIDHRREKAKEAGHTPPEFKITTYFMELYNEDIIDLFDPIYKGDGKAGIKIHEDSDGSIYVTGVTTRVVSSIDETLKCLRTGALSRTTGSTNMNAQSSRSHAIFTLLIKQQRLVPFDELEGCDDVPEFETLSAKFHFVDLAGSERLKRTGATGDRAREGISINCGLLALGNVISALGDISKKVSHVPYRDSKLTRLLQDSLGGNSRTLMIACVSPSDTDFMETLNTLKYANRARNIKNRITVNQDKTSKTIALLRQEIQELRIELIEYKQGKRIITEDGSEGINDMFHENQMLSSEANNLKSRVKALQDTIEILTTKNSQLLAERATGQWSNASEESEMTVVIQGYIKEIEEMRAKLCESENVCTQLRKQANSKMSASYKLSLSPLHSVPMTGSMISSMEEETQSITDLIEEAKRDLQYELDEAGKRKKPSDEPPPLNDANEDDESDAEEDDSSDDSEGGDNYNEELADLTSEISIKQKLIESLEQSHRRLETMKHQYEEKLNMLMNRIKATQDERDKVLANIKQGTTSGDEKVKSVRTEYQKKITRMEEELKKLKVAQKEHAKLMRERLQHEKQLKTLKSELSEMKRNKVKLMNKMKEDSNVARKEGLRRNKEITQLRKEQRKKENYIRNLEADNRLKNAVLKRKTEELSNLKKAPRRGLSNKAAGMLRKRFGPEFGSYSPKLAKNKWHSLEQTINKVAYNKQTVSSLERDMDRWLKERESLTRQLEKAKRRRERIDPSDFATYNDSNDQVEALKANIDYIYENIKECQENVMSMDENKEGNDLEVNRFVNGLGTNELQYLVDKLVTMSVNQATIAAQRQAAISELEGKMKQMEQTTSVQEQLLAHVLNDNDMNVYHLMSSLVAGDDNTPGSTESSRSSSPVDGRPGEKARRKPATTEDMLFNNNPERRMERMDSNMSASTFVLSSAQLSGGIDAYSTSASLSAPPTLDPRMTSSYEGSIGVGRGEDLINSQVQGLSGATFNSFRSGVPRVISAPNPLKDNQSDFTPPSSPVPYRKAVAKDDNVFSRLTSNTSSIKEMRPNTGVISPHSGRVNQRSVLACTHVAQGHSKAVLSVYATDDKIFSASKDRTAKVWDLVRGQEILSLGGHPNNVTCVKYSELHSSCFTVSSSFIKVWDIRENPVRCSRMLSSSGLTTTGSVSLTTNTRTLQMPPGENAINDISISESSNVLYSAASNIVRIWDLRKHLSVGKLSGSHQAAIMCLAVDSRNADQDVVVTGSKDHYIKVFDVGSNISGLINPRINLDPPHYDGIQSLALYGDTLFSGSRDMCIKKWDLRRGELVQSLNGAHKDWVCALCYLPGGQIVLSGCRSGIVKMWSAESCQLIGDLRAHASPINAITTNSTCIFTASNDCTIGLWRMRTSYDVSPELSDAA